MKLETLFDLSDKVALITGSSRGIGRAIAEAAAAAGARVVISSRNLEACEEAAEAINAEHGPGRAIALAATISAKASLEQLVSRTRAEFGKIDVLVCNAATNPYFGPMSGISDDQFRKILENNVLANHWLISMIAPEMKERNAGSIIIISSIGGFSGSEVIGSYNISKAADFQLVRNLAVELGRHNIRVNAIAPGLIKTEFARAIWENPEAEAAFNRATPLRRIGQPLDVAGASLFLACEASAYVTGQTIVVDGGLVIRGAT